MAQLELISFIPATASYQIWHPQNFIINETDDGIVTITSPNTGSNLTITSYQATQSVTEEILTSFLRDRTEGYISLSEIKSIITNERIWIEGEFKNDKAFWTWWGLASSNLIVLASINSEDTLDDSDRHLYTFMIDKMEIYPDEPDEQ